MITTEDKTLIAENVKVDMETLPKIYLTCFPYGADVIGHALAEDGEGLAYHLSSNESWAKHDMGLNSNWKHDIYKEHYPQGYELVWIDDPANDPQWQAALALNREKYPRDKEQ